jgi:ergothioneine biosynthesis protein EgtB
VTFPEGLREIGHDGPGFAFDNEGPRHRQFIDAFHLANRPTTNAEYLRFIEAGGYERPDWWLSEGWDACRSHGWAAPLYWERRGETWWTYTLAGPRPIAPDEPVTHVSYYEADAFARWSGARLPTEGEWEVAARDQPLEGHFLDDGDIHPRPAPESQPGPLLQTYGDVWEWTSSPYSPYPGFRPAQGAVGEYNGKFMCNQFVLRGGSCATPREHVRPTYRNFFHPPCRWQFSGIRLARDPD